jgi:uncharacterized membrane protein
MTNLIVASFKDENKAIKAMHKLTELDSFGDISIFEKAMVRAGENGKYEILQENTNEGWRTLTGMTVGGLLGALLGPVGFAVGLTTGTTIGLISDAGRQGFNESFVKKVGKRMAPDTVSIIAEIDEDSDIFVDNALKPFDAEIQRNDIDFEFDDFVMDEIDEIDKNISEAREKMKTSAGNEKEKIKKRIGELKQKRNELIVNARNDAKNFKEQINGEVNKRRAEFIKNRISRHVEKLNKLNEELHALNTKE